MMVPKTVQIFFLAEKEKHSFVNSLDLAWEKLFQVIIGLFCFFIFNYMGGGMHVSLLVKVLEACNYLYSWLYFRWSGSVVVINCILDAFSYLYINEGMSLHPLVYMSINPSVSPSDEC